MENKTTEISKNKSFIFACIGTLCFTESLEVNNFSCPQEADWVGNLWNVADNTENIVIGGTGFLLWGDLVSTTYTKI